MSPPSYLPPREGVGAWRCAEWAGALTHVWPGRFGPAASLVDARHTRCCCCASSSEAAAAARMQWSNAPAPRPSGCRPLACWPMAQQQHISRLALLLLLTSSGDVCVLCAQHGRARRLGVCWPLRPPLQQRTRSNNDTGWVKAPSVQHRAGRVRKCWRARLHREACAAARLCAACINLNNHIERMQRSAGSQVEGNRRSERRRCAAGGDARTRLQLQEVVGGADVGLPVSFRLSKEGFSAHH